MSQRFAGNFARPYDEHAEHSRRALFAKDRELVRLAARAASAENTLQFFADVIRDKGHRDPAWTIDAITQSLTQLGYVPKPSTTDSHDRPDCGASGTGGLP